MWSAVKLWASDVQRAEPRSLVVAVALVALVGSVGSFVGRWCYLVPSASFGNVGEWVAGSAAVAAILSLVKQFEVSRELKDEELTDQRLGVVRRECLRVAKEVEVTADLVYEDDVYGIFLRASAPEVMERFRPLASSLRGFQSVLPKVADGKADEVLEAASEWLAASGLAAGGEVARGFTDTAVRLAQALRDLASSL